MNRSLVRVGVLVLFSVTVFAQGPVAGTATDPLLGMWSLNMEKSTFTQGTAPTPGTISIRRYSLRPDGFMMTVFVTVTPEGEPTFLQVTWKYNSNDYPMYAPATLADLSIAGVTPGTMTYRSIDAYTTDLTPKDNAGKITFTGIRRRVVSRDGKSLIDTSRGTNAEGQKINNVLVFDRCNMQCIDLTSP